MFRRCVLPAIVGLAALLSACGSSSTDTTDAAAEQPVGSVGAPARTTAAPSGGGGIGGAVEVAVGALQGADVAACDIDHRTLEDASELYLALNGSLPPDQNALVEAQILREVSPRFEITAEGAIVPAPGSPCV